MRPSVPVPRLRRPAGAALVLVLCALIPGLACVPPQSGGPTSWPARTAALQKEIVARLSGAAEIKPGVMLTDRSTLDSRRLAREALAEVWRGLGLDVQTQAYAEGAANLYAVVRASRPASESVVLGAHFDGPRNSPGANDNATGTALVTAVAAEFHHARPRSRNLLFALFDEEERGLRGSRAMAKKLKDDGLAVHSVLTIDQMGWDKDLDRAVELEIPYPGAFDLFTRAAAGLKPRPPILVTQERGSDHSAFRSLGFAAVGLTEEYHNGDTTPHFHRPGDAYDTVDFDYLKSTTLLVIAALRELTR